MAKNTGKISQIIGPVVDVSFERQGSEMPDIYDALEIKRDDGSTPPFQAVTGHSLGSRKRAQGRIACPAEGRGIAATRVKMATGGRIGR